MMAMDTMTTVAGLAEILHLNRNQQVLDKLKLFQMPGYIYITNLLCINKESIGPTSRFKNTLLPTLFLPCRHACGTTLLKEL